MERGWILSVAVVMVFVAAGVQGANNTQVEITRAGCGLTKLCVETPDDCDPARTEDDCLFVSVVAGAPAAPDLTATNLSMELSGQSQGYVALGLANENNTVFFICGQNASANGTFVFRTMQRNNTDTALSPNVTEIQGSVKDNMIQCRFNVPTVNATHTRTRSSPVTTFSILLGTGLLDGDAIGAPNISLQSGPLDIANPASMVTATVSDPTIPSIIYVAPPTTKPPPPPSNNSMTSGASSGPHPPSLFLLLIVFTRSLMQRA